MNSTTKNGEENNGGQEKDIGMKQQRQKKDQIDERINLLGTDKNRKEKRGLRFHAPEVTKKSGEKTRTVFKYCSMVLFFASHLFRAKLIQIIIYIMLMVPNAIG